MLCVDPTKLSESQRGHFVRAMKKLATRPLGTIFEELGGSGPENFDINKVRRDRLDLDNLVFEVLGFSTEERAEIYRGLLDLIVARVDRAQTTVKRKRGTPKVAALAEGILRQLDPSLLKR